MTKKKANQKVKQEVLTDLMDTKGYDDHQKHVEAMEKFEEKRQKEVETHKKYVEESKKYNQQLKESPEKKFIEKMEKVIEDNLPPLGLTSPPLTTSLPEKEVLKDSAGLTLFDKEEEVSPVEQVKVSQMKRDPVVLDVQVRCTRNYVASVLKTICEGMPSIFPTYITWDTDVDVVERVYEDLQSVGYVRELLPTAAMMLGQANFGNPIWRSQVMVGLAVYDAARTLGDVEVARHIREGMKYWTE